MFIPTGATFVCKYWTGFRGFSIDAASLLQKPKHAIKMEYVKCNIPYSSPIASRGVLYSLLKKDSGWSAMAAPTQLTAKAFTLTLTSLSGTKAGEKKKKGGVYLKASWIVWVN